MVVHKHTVHHGSVRHVYTMPWTTQDVHAGLYQPEFQDTTSLSYGATAPAKNIHTNTHSYTHPHTYTLTETSQQKQLMQIERRQKFKRKVTECIQTQQPLFLKVCVLVVLQNYFAKLSTGEHLMSQYFVKLFNQIGIVCL